MKNMTKVEVAIIAANFEFEACIILGLAPCGWRPEVPRSWCEADGSVYELVEVTVSPHKVKGCSRDQGCSASGAQRGIRSGGRWCRPPLHAGHGVEEDVAQAAMPRCAHSTWIAAQPRPRFYVR
ncbi:MAG: hypothetical protein ABIT20_24080 [Gemmatimonadaceae bacterium]